MNHAGPRGERGETGPRGRLPKGAARAVVYLFLVAALFSALTFAGLVHYIGTQKAAEQRQGQMVEQKLCASFGKLAALKPPAGNPAANPSRAYLQEQHAALDELGADLGCTR